ncbi:MAG: hypothetical protein ACJ79U_07770 [Myxococcales bacterium]
MKLIVTTTIAAALLAGCTTHGEDSFLVATKLVQATAGDVAGTCIYDAATLENAFGRFDPAAGYVHAVVVENRLQDNTDLNVGRFNTNEFQVEGATVKTEVLVGPAQSIPDQTVPANGLILVAGSLPIAIQLAQPGAIQAGSEVRFHIQVFGRLLDGSKVSTSTYQYTAAADTVAQPSVNPCGTGTTVFCEGPDPAVRSQDTGVSCPAAAATP